MSLKTESQIGLCPKLRKHFGAETVFDKVLAQPGEVFRHVKGRKTLRFIANGDAFFLKIHAGVGWKEIFKNLLYCRLPILGARNELAAIRRLEELGIRSMKIAGFGQRNWNPARTESFLITEELNNTISLEDLCKDWAADPPPFQLKRALIENVARIARTIHENGLNHRDFYICHFLLNRLCLRASRNPNDLTIHLIDLHRALIHRRVPRRWVIKDVAGLFFSSMDVGLSKRDLFRFMKAYRGKPLREILVSEHRFWETVAAQARRLYQKHERTETCASAMDQRKAA